MTWKKLLLGIAIFLILAAPTIATIYGQDDFNRADSATVGNNWTEVESAGTASISSNTLKIENTGIANYLYVIRNITGTMNNIEAWMKTDTPTTESYITIMGASGEMCRIGFNNGDIQYYNGGSWTTLKASALADTYYRLEFRNISYTSYTTDLAVNGEVLGKNIPFWHNSSEITKIKFNNGDDGTARILTVDNVTWGSYPLYGAASVGDTLNISSPRPETDSQFNISTVRFNLTANATYQFTCDLYFNNTLNTSQSYGVDDKDLIAYYDFDSDFTDKIRGYDGTSYGAEIRNGALYCNASESDYVDLGEAWGNFTDANFTIAFRFKVPKDAQHRVVLSKGISWNGGFLIYKNTADYMTIYSNDGEINVGTKTTWNSNEWTDAVFVRNGSVVKVYINGEYVTEDGSADAHINSSYKWTLCAANGGTDRFYNGSIDDLYVFNRSLSPKEVKALYYGRIAGYSPINKNNLFLNYTLNMGDGDYDYFFSCYDNMSTANTTKNNIYVDTIAPSITWTSLDGNDTTWSGEQDLEIVTSETTPYSIEISDTCGFYYYSNTLTSPYVFNQTIDLINCTGQQQTTTVTFCDGLTDALTCIERTYSWNSYSRLNVTAYSFTGTPIQEFSVYVNGNLDGSTTNYYYLVEGLNQTYYNITITATGYATESANITINATYQEYNFTLYTRNSITFEIRDEEDETLITNNTVSIELISDAFANNYTTNNGTLYLDLLYPVQYTIRYSAQGYPERFYNIQIYNNTHSPLTLYLLKNTSATQVTATVYDEERNVVEDAYIKALRYDLDTNSYIVREIVKTNFEGEAVLNLQLDTEYYKFIIEYPFGTVVLETSPDYVRQTQIEFEITLGEGIASSFYKEMAISYTDIIFNNETQNFRWTYSDSGSTLTKACMEVYILSLLDEKELGTTCSSEPAATLLYYAPNITGRTYEAKAYAYFGEEKRLLASTTYTYPKGGVSGNSGMFWIAMLMIIFAATGVWSKQLALISTPLPLFFGSIIGIINISLPTAATIEIIAIIIAIVISRGGG